MTKNLQISNKNKNILIGAKKAFAVFALFLMAPGNVFALSLNEQINKAENALSSTQTEKNSLAREVARFNSEISLAEQEIYKTNLKISALNEKISKTKSDIKMAEKELARLRLQLQEVIRVMYEEGQISSIEVIAKAGSFSEYVNRSEYLEQINSKVKEASDRVVGLKRKLETDKRNLELNKKQVLKEKQKQVSERNAISATRNAKNQLLLQTKGDEATYKKLLASLYAKRAALSRQNGEIVRGGGSGGYPGYSYVDPWNFISYQCTSYAAWNWNMVQGKHWTNTRPGQGNAWNWPALASDQGYTTTSTPSIGAIAVWPMTSTTPYGHVAIVTSVYGGKMSVAEYNWSIAEHYGERDNVSIYGLKFIH